MLIDFQNKIFTGSKGRKSVFDFQLPESAKGVIIFTHGYKGFKDWGAWNPMQDYFVEKGYGFVKFNMSHNGGTVDELIDFPDLEAFGRNTYSFEVTDLNLIIDETHRIIHQECELDLPIFLIGHSQGGGISILAASQNDKVAKLVSLAGISSIATRFPTGEKLLEWEREGVRYVENQRTKQAMPHFYSQFEDFLKHANHLDIEAAARSLNMPFKQVHGDMDLAVSISEGQLVAAWTETDLEIVKGAGHTFGAVHPWTAEKLPEDLAFALAAIVRFFEQE